MKANRAFKQGDEAVSPVIAVILMVAITVVLAATVYVWVSGFGQSGAQAKNLSVTQSGTLITDDATAGTTCGDTGATETWCAKWTIVSVSPSFAEGKLKVTDSTTSVGTIACVKNSATTAISASSTTALAAGDVLKCYGTGTDAAKGDLINFIDTVSNTVVATVTLN